MIMTMSWTFEECKDKCRDYLQKITNLKADTEFLSTLQASCSTFLKKFEERCTTAHNLEIFKTEFENAKKAYDVPTMEKYDILKTRVRIYDPHIPHASNDDTKKKDINITKYFNERKLVKQYIDALEMFIEKMNLLAPKDSVSQIEVQEPTFSGGNVENKKGLTALLRRLELL